MNNLHRELAPISDAAWAHLEDEARRTFTRHLAGRRVVDVLGPQAGAVRRGHRAPASGRRARPRACSSTQRAVQPIVELRVPFTVDRQAVDDVERGAKDSDWQPVKDAARQIAFAEDRTVFDGFAAAGIVGIAAGCPTRRSALPARRPRLPRRGRAGRDRAAAGRCRRALRLLLSADAYTAVSETHRPRLPDPRAHRAAAATARSSGRRPSTGPCCCPPAAATTSCTSARTCRSATCPTTPTTSSSTSRSR